MLFAIITTTNAAIAQIQPPTTPDVVLMTGQVGVQNTGSDMAALNGDYWQAVVWDGNTPTIAVYELPSGNIYTRALGGGFLRAVDPDVAINHGNPNYPMADSIIVVYEAQIGGALHVFYEKFGISTSGLVPAFGGPQQLSTVAPARHANVDINFNGKGAIIWDENRELAIATIDFTLGGLVTVDGTKLPAPGGGNFIQPDITLTGNQFFTGHMYWTAVEELPGTSLQVHHYESPWDVTPITNGTLNLIGSSVTYGPPFEIDAPKINGGWNVTDRLLTYTVRDAFTNLSEVHFEQPQFGTGSLSNSFGLSLMPFKNARSVVDYNGDICFVCWEFDDANVGIYRAFNELICHHYFHDGTIYPTSFPDYSAVADGVNGDVSALSVCGSLGLAGFAWYENGVDEIRIKHSTTTSANYRSAKPALPKRSEDQVVLKLYPNPASDELNISGLTQSPIDVKLLNMQGQIMGAYTALTDEVQLEIKQLANGMYWVEVLSNGQVKRLRFIKK